MKVLVSIQNSEDCISNLDRIIHCAGCVLVVLELADFINFRAFPKLSYSDLERLLRAFSWGKTNVQIANVL